MTILYDSLSYNQEMLLDLPLREGIGIVTMDVAKPHHVVNLINTPTWTVLPSGLMTLNFDGMTEYMECAGAVCADLNFMAGDYSVGGWFNWADSVHDSQNLIGRYEVSVSGWEVYLTEAAALRYLSLRHHHAGTLDPITGNPRTSAYSLGWAYGTNWHFGISRIGNTAYMYRNGQPVTTVSEALIDPETSARDLVIGVRGVTKNANFFSNMRGRVIVSGKALTAEDWANMYQHQARWYA